MTTTRRHAPQMKNVAVSMQISIADYITSRKEEAIGHWEQWRNAQYETDEHKQAVDDVFGEYIRTLDEILESLLPF